VAIRLSLPDGTAVETDTAEEALQFLRLVTTRAAPETRALSLDALPASARRLIETLAAQPDGLKGHDLAKALGIEPKGLGPVVVSILKWGRKIGLQKRDVLVKARRREAGVPVRIIRLASPLLKRLREEGLV
jgi:hypothetical protein